MLASGRLSSDHVFQNRRPSVLSTNLYEERLQIRHLHYDWRCFRLQHCSHAVADICLPADRQKLGCNYHLRHVYQSACGILGEWCPQCRHRLCDSLDAGPHDSWLVSSASSETAVIGNVQRWIFVSRKVGAARAPYRLMHPCRTVVVSIIRLKTLIPTLHAIDQTWAIANPGNWMSVTLANIRWRLYTDNFDSIVEINLAVACGCLAVIRPFLRHHFPKLMGETRNSRTEQYDKASRSDYFSRRVRSNRRTLDDSGSESKARLSHGNHNLPGWNAVAYAQDTKATCSRAIDKSSDDLELGDLESGVSKDVGSVPYPKKSHTASTSTHNIGFAKDMGKHELAGGIVKTISVDIQR